MKFNFEIFKNIEKNLDLRKIPIEDVSPEIRKKFENKEWKNIPINENVDITPKVLEVVPNRPFINQAMACPAYYKTVTEGFENDGKLKGFGELAQAIEGDIQTSPLVKVRPDLKKNLDRAQRILDNNPKTKNLQLVVVDGYRRIDVQEKLFNAYYGYVVSKNPGLTEEEYKNLAKKMVSEPPSDLNVLRQSPPPHSTGGSVDVILVFKNKINTKSDYWLNEAMVPFGAKFDEMMDPVYKDERSETVFYEKKLKKEKLNSEEQKALEFRRILYHTLSEVGFTNYYTEFWHFDYGNQFNALTAGKKEAEYCYAGGIENNQIKENLTAEIQSFQMYANKVGEEEAEKVKNHFGL